MEKLDIYKNKQKTCTQNDFTQISENKEILNINKKMNGIFHWCRIADLRITSVKQWLNRNWFPLLALPPTEPRWHQL